MRRFVLGATILLACASGNAHSAPMTWVAGKGIDTGICTLAAPCRTFAYAHAQTNAGGSINVLSPGSFGPVTITKPISIVADGVEAAINSAANGSALNVQAPAGAVVSLRGLTLDFTGSDGIAFISGGALHIQDCVIRRVNFGVFFVGSTGNNELYITNSVIADVLETGLFVQPALTAGAKVTINNVQILNAKGDGVFINGSNTTGVLRLTLRKVTSAGNAGSGIVIKEAGTNATDVTIDAVTLINNGGGLYVATATARIGNSVVTGNATGVTAAFGGALISYGNNQVAGNGVDGAPTSTIALK